jgi:HipA-like protein
MRQAKILYKTEEAGILTQHDDGSFTFIYNDLWLADSSKSAISLTLPKTQQSYRSQYLFPFFYNMLPEGANKQIACKYLRIDENDHFGLLLNTANYDTIGAVTVQKIQESQ